jgi:hypothetical protein
MNQNNHQLRSALYQLSTQANAIAEYMLHADTTLSEQLDKLADSILAIPKLNARLVRKLGDQGAARNATIVNADIVVNTSISAEQMANLAEMIRNQKTGEPTPLVAGTQAGIALANANHRISMLEERLQAAREFVEVYVKGSFFGHNAKSELFKIDELLGTKP